MASRSGGGRSGEGAATFNVAGGGASARAANAAPTAPTTGIDVLLALQGAPDPVQGRRKQIRRGRSLLDALDALKADLLTGNGGEGHLNRLQALVGQAREKTEPGLDGVLDDIELRVRVELAKRGHFPSG